MQQRRNQMATKRSKRASKASAARSKRKVRARATPTERRAQPKGVINAWEDDPSAGAQPSFYDREGLKFFHATAAGRTVFSGESPDIVCHELGHAILDSFKPQLFDAASIEVAAFHESFGDMSALLSALQLPSVREAVLAETGGVLGRSSRLSRLAEQLGWAIRQSVPSAVEPDCLRNAVNTLFYRDPDTLPTTAPGTSLSSEPHSFSRVFTGAFFEGLAS